MTGVQTCALPIFHRMVRVTFGYADRFAAIFGQERVAAVAPSLEDAYGHGAEAVEAETSRIHPKIP